MTQAEIKQWTDLSEQPWTSLILGNGASIALNEAFNYQTLHGVAATNGLLPATEQLFKRLGTTDFEHVLLACWYAEHVNAALGEPSKAISEAYKEVRSALIEAVHNVHPLHADIATDLHRAGIFASAFPTVINLNYDLTLYWAIMMFNSANGRWFKDAFPDGEFRPDWDYLRVPYGQAKGATLIFYPHGSLTIARDYIGNEKKLSAREGSADLLNAITEQWASGRYVPVFVSEGTSEKKVAAIRRSRYLINVYEEVLPKLGENLVIYGWSINERDRHVLQMIAEGAPKRVAISVFTGHPQEEQQAFCNQVLNTLGRFLPHADIIFFDSRSPGCWNNS